MVHFLLDCSLFVYFLTSFNRLYFVIFLWFRVGFEVIVSEYIHFLLIGWFVYFRIWLGETFNTWGSKNIGGSVFI